MACETETSEGLSLASSTGVGTVTLSTTSKSSDSIISLTTAKVSSFTTLCATCSYEQFIEKPWEMMELLKPVRMRADLDDTYDTWMVSQEGGHSNSRRPDQVHRCWPEQQPCQLHGSNWGVGEGSHRGDFRTIGGIPLLTMPGDTEMPCYINGSAHAGEPPDGVHDEEST